MKAAAPTHTLEHEVRILEGMMPICSVCKRIRATDMTWESLEAYAQRIGRVTSRLSLAGIRIAY
jgi:hypothetical protein